MLQALFRRRMLLPWLCCVVLCFGKPKKAEAVHTLATITIVIGKEGGEGERGRERERGKEERKRRPPAYKFHAKGNLRAGQYIPIHPHI